LSKPRFSSNWRIFLNVSADGGPFLVAMPRVYHAGSQPLGKAAIPMLTFFGSMAVGLMLVSYWLEPRSKWFVLAFALGCTATSLYSGLVEAYPITAIEALWALVALRRFWMRHKTGDISPGMPGAS
jgi:hypothetical protein